MTPLQNLLYFSFSTTRPSRSRVRTTVFCSRPGHCTRSRIWSVPVRLAVAADLLDHLALRADDEAVGGEVVEVGADALGRHEARGAAPARIGLVLEGQRLAHLVERVAGPLPTWHSRMIGYSAAGFRPAAARVSRNSAFSLPTLFLRHHRRGEPGVGELCRALDRRLEIARHPDRRPAGLLGLRWPARC